MGYRAVEGYISRWRWTRAPHALCSNFTLEHRDSSFLSTRPSFRIWQSRRGGCYTYRARHGDWLRDGEGCPPRPATGRGHSSLVQSWARIACQPPRTAAHATSTSKVPRPCRSQKSSGAEGEDLPRSLDRVWQRETNESRVRIRAGSRQLSRTNIGPPTPMHGLGGGRSTRIHSTRTVKLHVDRMSRRSQEFWSAEASDVHQQCSPWSGQSGCPVCPSLS